MPVRVDDIVEALSQLGGEAHLSDIVAKVKTIAPPPLPRDIGAGIRARIQERCSEAVSFKGGDDLFESVYGIENRRGRWRLKRDQLSPYATDGFLDGADAEFQAEEWRSQLRIHLRRERSRELVRKFKECLSNYCCAVCGFDFEATYGPIGRRFIEAHHNKPVSELRAGELTSINDLAPVCSNCHRMLHRDGNIGVAELRLSLRT